MKIPEEKELKEGSLMRVSQDLWGILTKPQLGEDKTGLVQMKKDLQLVQISINKLFSSTYCLMVEPMSNEEVYVKQGGKFEGNYSLKVSKYIELI